MRNFASPSRYIQGENALFENAKSHFRVGTHPVFYYVTQWFMILWVNVSKNTLLQNGLTVLQSSLMEKHRIRKLIVWSA